MNNLRSAIFLGEGGLAMECIKILMDSGFFVKYIVTTDNALLEYGDKNKVPAIVTKSVEVLEQSIADQTFDYLFSIVNEIKLSDKILRQILVLSVNFHDSPLPKYAGVNATAWAIINNEEKHAITWHEIDAEYDRGDVLHQEEIMIDKEETSFSLNGKCFVAGIQSFKTLTENIVLNKIQKKPQNQQQRLYISRFRNHALNNKHLWVGGILKWNLTTHEILRIMNALDFGPVENPLAIPKVLIHDRFYFFSALKVSSFFSNTRPGTVLQVKDDGIEIKIKNGSLMLSGLKTEKAEHVPASLLCDVAVGQHLPDIGIDDAERIRAIDSTVCLHEKYWKKEIMGAEVCCNPFQQEKIQSSINIDIDYGNLFVDESAIIGIITAAVCRLNQQEKCTFGYIPDRIGEYSCVGGIFEKILPLTVVCQAERDLSYHVSETSKKIRSMWKHKTFAKDLYQRMGVSPLNYENTFIFCYHRDWEEDSSLRSGKAVFVHIDSDAQKITLKTNHTIAGFERIILHFLHCFKKCKDTPVMDFPLIQNSNPNPSGWIKNSWKNYNSIAEEIDLKAERDPDAVAMVCNSYDITYSRLKVNTETIALNLLKNGIHAGDLIGLYIKNPVHQIYLIVSAQRLGVAFVPLDPDYPKERIEYMVNDSRCRALIYDTEQPDFLENTIVCSCDSLMSNLQSSVGNMNYDWQENDLSYMVYTSGSSGKPKGVMIPQRGLCNLKPVQAELFNIRQTDKILLFSSFSFDASIWEITLALYHGAAIVVQNDFRRMPGMELLSYLKEKKVTIVSMPPSAIANLPKEELPDLRIFISGSEACWNDLANTWMTESRAFFNGYGPTETTVCATFYQCNENEDNIRIGKPIANTKIFILDQYGHHLPNGVVGEICIGGEGLALGYLNLPDLSREKFISVKVQDEEVKVYRSGDLGYIDASNNLNFCGRMDHQVKLRGFRIELEEIEQNLLSNPLINNALVVLQTINNSKYIVAYVILLNDLSDERIRTYLKKSLPDYMIPSFFIRMERFPMMPNGKPDRKALPDPQIQIHSESATMPGSKMEKEMYDIWKSVIGFGCFGMEDDFFDIGGDSLLAVQVMTQICDRFNAKLPISTIFSKRTIKSLSEVLDNHHFDATLAFCPMIKMNKAVTIHKMYAVHPGDGNVFCFLDLVKNLGDKVEFYAFQAFGVEKGTKPLDRIKDIASVYVKEILDSRPKKLSIIGYCAGGTIAFEMVHQLEEMGVPVENLILMDAWAPHTYSSVKESENFYFFAKNFEGIVGAPLFEEYCKYNGIPYNERDILLKLEGQTLEKRLEQLGICADKLSMLPAGVDISYLERLFYVWQGLGSMVVYDPPCLKTPVQLIRAKNDVQNNLRDYTTMGWEKHVSGLRVVNSPGDHYTMMKKENSISLASIVLKIYKNLME